MQNKMSNLNPSNNYYPIHLVVLFSNHSVYLLDRLKLISIKQWSQWPTLLQPRNFGNFTSMLRGLKLLRRTLSWMFLLKEFNQGGRTHRTSRVEPGHSELEKHMQILFGKICCLASLENSLNLSMRSLEFWFMQQQLISTSFKSGLDMGETRKSKLKCEKTSCAL